MAQAVFPLSFFLILFLVTNGMMEEMTFYFKNTILEGNHGRKQI